MTDAVEDLAAWLTQIWDEEERLAESAVGDVAAMQIDNYGHLTVPAAWVLARIAADRAVLALHQPDRPPDTWYWSERECAGCGRRWHGGTPIGTPQTVIGPERGCTTVRLLASPHKDRPGFRPEWSVERQGVEW